MSEREIVRQALLDAADWQDGLADSYNHMRSDPAYAAAKRQAKLYRALLKKRYGDSRSNMDKMLEGSTTITVEEAYAKEAHPMTNSPIHGDVVASLLEQAKAASDASKYVAATKGENYAWLTPAQTLEARAADLIEALQRELAETKELNLLLSQVSPYEAMKDRAEAAEKDRDEYRAVAEIWHTNYENVLKQLDAAESLASSARRLALEEAAQIAHGAFLKWAKGPKMLAGAALGASDIEKAILALIDPPAAVRDIKGAV